MTRPSGPKAARRDVARDVSGDSTTPSEVLEVVPALIGTAS